MSNVIKFFNPQDKQYGYLSNNFQHEMFIDGKKWFSVTNYVYTNCLNTSINQTLIANTKPKEVQKIFNKLYNEEIQNVIKRSVNTGINAKFYNNTELQELLLETGNRPIIYVDNDKLLGNGNGQGQGKNLYGVYLMQKRHELLINYKEDKEKSDEKKLHDLVYNTYVAQSLLTKLYKQNASDLSEYENKSAEEIVEQMPSSNIDRDVIIKMYNKGSLPDVKRDLYNSQNIIAQIRKKHSKNIRSIGLSKCKNILFNLYVDYIISQAYPELSKKSYDKAKRQQFSEVNIQEKIEMQNNVMKLYENGMLAPEIVNLYEDIIKEIYIPSKEEITLYENIVITNNEDPIIKDTIYTSSTGEPVYIYIKDFPQMDPKYKKYLALSTYNMEVPFKVSGYVFQSIHHFIMFSLINYKLKDMEKSYDYIKGKDFGEISKNYHMITNKRYADNLKGNAKIALDKKFSNKGLADMLLLTGDSYLINEDFNNPILGVGNDKKGQNFTGVYLMELRQKIKSQKEQEPEIKVSVDDIVYLFEKDTYLNNWMKNKVTDMCSTLNFMQSYIWYKNTFDTGYDEQFCADVIDIIYQPCSEIYSRVGDINEDVPAFFRALVLKCNGLKKATPETITVLWKRIYVMVSILISNFTNKSISNIKSILYKSQQKLSIKPANCVKLIIGDSYDNCIISALLNVLNNINVFNNKFEDYDSEITDIDISTAASIILNKDVKDRIVIDPEFPDDEPEFPDGEPDFPDGEPDIVFDFDDDTPQSDEGDYGNEPESDDDGYSPSKELLKNNLLRLNITPEKLDDIVKLIMSSKDIIKNYPMKDNIKYNRINYFSSQNT